MRLLIALALMLSPALARAEPPETWVLTRRSVQSVAIPEAIAAHPVLAELELDPGSRTLQLARRDLDGDGAAEYFVQSAASLCGNGGFPYAIFDARSHAYLGQVFGNRIREASDRFNGWAVLECFSHLSAASTAYALFAFSGTGYARVSSLELPEGVIRRLQEPE